MRPLTSARWPPLAVALAVGLICAPPAGADRAPSHEAGAQKVGPAAGHGPFAGRVAIRGDRRLYLECRGSGRPTVMLEAGTGNLGSIWTEPPDGPGPPVLPAVARFTRVCAYDRPGTYQLPRHAEPKRSGGDAADGSGHRSRPTRPAAGGRRPPPLRAGRPLVWRHGRAPLRDEPSQGGRRAGLDRRSERGLRRRVEAAVAPGRVRGRSARPTAPAGAGELPGGGDPRPRAERRPDAPGTGRHAAAPDAVRRPLTLPDHPEPVRLPARVPDRGAGHAHFRTHRTCWPSSCRAPST